MQHTNVISVAAPEQDTVLGGRGNTVGPIELSPGLTSGKVTQAMPNAPKCFAAVLGGGASRSGGMLQPFSGLGSQPARHSPCRRESSA